MSKRRQAEPTRAFAIRLTETERAELQRRAGELALGSYMKAVLFADGDKRRRRGARAPVKDHVKLAEVLACLGQSRISESLEQLAKAAESGTLYVDDSVPQAIKKACDDICVMRLMLMSALGFQLPKTDNGTTESVSQSFTRAASFEEP